MDTMLFAVLLYTVGSIDRNDVKRVKDVGAVLLINEQNHPSTDRDEIGMRHIETAPVRKVNNEWMEIGS